MTAFNFRSLLLAAIVLSNCITWTASRHHYAHNVHQHRTRHRRQGAGLYLPASYSIPGGEGSGPWGEWGAISPCSRTCGGGVASQKRICLQPGPEGQSQCTGGDTKYFSCQTQDCPEGSGDFRAEQCAEFNDKLFRGFKYNWVPYTKAPNPCELNCMPHGERFYFRHKLQVIDGTRCNDESFDVCVNGRCEPVGCDMMLNSTAREDKCRECRGNGANCHTTGGIFNSQDLTKGYNDILLIPAGSTSINIEELAPSNNYLALRAKNGTYYLNGHYHIDFPRSILIAGALWTYERSQQGFAAPDKLRCLGPTNEPLYLSLLLQDENVGISYEYSVPNNSAPPTDKRYNWAHEEFTPCSATCGGGFQTRNVTCRSREELELVDDSLCDEGLKPTTNQSCNPDPCPAQWVEGPWGECSKRCGEGGVRSREVNCQKIIAHGQNSIVPEKECFDLLGPKPEVFQKCNEDAPCPTWFVGHWGPCDKLCDEGKQKRQVVCYQKKNGRIEVLTDDDCTEEKPQEEQTCMLKPCDGADWVTTSWSGCDTCTSKNRTRLLLCARRGRIVLDEKYCEHHPRPHIFEECIEKDLPPCEVQWYATQWSKCSVSCGEGVQTRKVFCGMYFSNEEGEGVERVHDDKCANLTKYKDTKPCTVPKEECPSQWFAGPWSKCTKKCGGGDQNRRIMCFRGDKEAGDCGMSTVPDPTQLCNPQSCDLDELLPVSKTSTVIMEDSDECEEDYEEVGLDSFTTDMMMSDSGYAEHESTLETGSGFSSLSTDDLTTEGSGFSTTDTTDSDYTSDYETGSGETSTTDISTTAAKDKHKSTTTTINPPTEKEIIIGLTGASASADTGSTVEDTGSTPTDITTGSEDTESTVTEETESTVTGDTGSTSSDTGSTSSEETSVTEASGATTETGSTDGSESTIVKETGSTSESGSTSSTGSSDTDGAGSTTEAGTGSTDSSLSTETKETELTSESSSTSSGETAVTDTSDTGSTGTGETESTDSSASTVSKETGSTSETDSTSSGETTSTGETSSTNTEKTESTVSGGTDESSSTDETESTVSGGTDETVSTGETESTVTETTGPTESTVTEKTSPSESTVTEETSSTESTVTEKTESTESTVTDETESTESTVTEKTESTESTVTEETESTESTVTEETGSTESTVTEETGSTESTVTEETGSTESTVTEETGSTESTITEETGSTITSESESEGTDTTISGSTNTEGTSDTEDTTTGSTDSTSTPKVAKGSTTTTRAVPTESEPSSTGKSTTLSSTESSETTESSTDTSVSTVETSTSGAESTDSESTSEGTVSSTVESSTSSGSESTGSESTSEEAVSSTAESSTSSGAESTGSESTSEEAVSSTVESSTISGSDSTTEASSTISAESTTESSSLGAETSTLSETESTTEAIESSSVSSSVSTEAESTTSSGSESTTETSESSTTSVGSESTTDVSGSSTEESTTVSGEITTGTESTEETSTGSGSTTESTGAEETTSYSTTEGATGSTEETETTTTEVSSTAGPTGTTIWTKTTVLLPGKNVCKPRKPKCSKTKFGCCPDRKTTALGPFDEGCDKPRTCKESRYGCCPDGLSAAQGDNNEGCPVEPCADTLFGCCASDNKTAAQGNDQDGCPPPPPACITSKFGCCADNETEATGPAKQGCPETETSTTEALTDTTTETTESIETSEGSTTNEGTTDVTGTTTLDPCSSFEFGCCADNETEASGPDGQGCPCNATEFGCCPDGVSPASGLENKGCPGPCRTSTYGCCQDEKTPAHGPDFEGCCLLQAFGCCPDNRKPAEGPHLEGCGCQYALHGCCPDNVTIAQGPDNQGCGCQYTEHGCCPDRHTAASGPNYEGCACNTYQFGCCNDGITVATGPEQQGCRCRDSKFGCCGDGETAATGPGGAGCDCSSSRHGCCPDGHTEASGPKFLGCTDVPENRQAACSLSTDPGPCHNFTAMWFYDLAYGGCSRFWYGGCDGNGNRFSTKEECEDVCVQPSPKDACKLPSVKGACDGEYQRWHYNSTREQCIPFRYGGCLGNANNFDSRELCQKQCEPSSVEGQCELPIDQGSCAGNYSRWGFNSETNRCEQFIWGGCEGNSNRFSSEAACQMRCVGSQPPLCTQPQEAGNCTEKEALWSFSQSENRCLPFYYSGCGGNDNRFSSREACEQTCPSAYVADKCTLPAETGQCSNYRERWFYDTTFKRCRQFYYGGCGGNENNFGTEAECENSCSEIKTTTTTTTTTARPTRPQPEPHTPESDHRPGTSGFCFYDIDVGPCNKTETRYAYDRALGRCVTFQYGGCGGNRNNFPDEAYCSYYCQPMQDICQLPMLQGPCDDSLMRWFYDPTTDTCSQFTYGGCEGNDNRFESLEACESRCRTGPAPVEPTTPSTTVIVDVPSECAVPEALEDCRYGGLVWYFDRSRHECVSHANHQEAGPVCRYSGTFPSQEACERSCGAFRGIDVCKQPRDVGPCQSYVTKVYFEPSTGQCHEFSYGGCLGGANRFSSIEECSQVCKAEIADPCSLPPEGGNCFSYIQQWYYDASRDECNQFVYTGCSGNDNRFETQRDCEARCKRPAATTTTVATPAQQPAESECRTPESLAPCGNNVTVFYYDSERRECLVSGIGGCGHPNSYSTEEECERSCGAFRGVEVCGARLDPGPCRAAIPKIYWDALTGSCQPYTYGGCGGGPNRFSSVEECMNVCGDTGPDQNQIVTQDCTAYRQQCEALDCRYGVDSYAENGCQRCICREDPCSRVNCQPNERCEAVAARDPATQEPVYSARCVLETNEVVDDCDEYVTNCSRLRCEYGVQRTRLPDGCEKCSCVQVEIDCEPLHQECKQLKCNYGVERIMGADGCERCKCKEHPCERKSCAAGERCVVQQYVNGLDPEPKYTAECRTIVKEGVCPTDETTTNEVVCRRECGDDADCRGVGKCCRRGCSDLCLVPVEQTSPHPLLTTTIAPNVPAAPIALPPQEPEVTASEGGAATLRCLFHGNPPPKITWTFGELTIDGNAGRYRLLSDGALQIVSLYRNDTGVYICVADNDLGQATQEIHLVVNDPETMPVGIAGEENAVVTGELGSPLQVRCLAYGYPPPSVFWYRGYEGTMVPYNDAVYEARGNVLLIRRLAIETLGQYTCQAYNGEGKAASWVVLVRAYQPEGLFIENEWLVPRNSVVPRPRTELPTTAESTTTTTTTTTEAPRPLFTVPVSTHVSTPSSAMNIGADLHLTCEVDGFPEPDVHWTKDGAVIQSDGRITITSSAIVSRLTVARVSVADSGLYACHASNPYTSHSDTVQINVQQLLVPAKCTDNPFFADCNLIVRSKFCRHKYYSKFCCKSCVEAGQLDPQEAELQADQPYRKK